jgi:hypothetical protein
MFTYRQLFTALVLCAVLLQIAACTGAGDPGQVSVDHGYDANPADELLHSLNSELLQQLDSLGKSVDSAASQAPTGKGNHVLASRLEGVLPDGAGYSGAVRLLFVPRIAGDYDGNGEVGLSDITPLARNFGFSVQYTDPDQPGSPDNLPAGDPFADGFANWKLARIDGDGNGVITSADITPIAVHFGERAEGWRVEYRSSADAEFELLPGAGELDGYSMPFRSGQVNDLVSEVLLPWPAGGFTEVRLQAWSTASAAGAEFSPSVQYSYEDTGCTAGLQVIESHGPAPFMASFTAEGSSVLADLFILNFGDGVTQKLTSISDFPVEHLYASPGVYTARLTVSCFPVLKDATVEVAATPIPSSQNMAMHLFNNNGFAPQTVQFYFLGSEDELYDFSLDYGDGTALLEGSGKLSELPLQHEYLVSGNHQAVLTLVDRYGDVITRAEYIYLQPSSPSVNVNLEIEQESGIPTLPMRFRFDGTTGDTATLDLGPNIPISVINLSLQDQLELSPSQTELLRKSELARLTIEANGIFYSDSVLLHPATGLPKNPKIRVNLSALTGIGSAEQPLPGVTFRMTADKPWPEVPTFTTNTSGNISIDPDAFDLLEHVKINGTLYLTPEQFYFDQLSSDYSWPVESLKISLYEILYGSERYIKLTPLN